jgi:hypothetical protein
MVGVDSRILPLTERFIVLFNFPDEAWGRARQLFLKAGRGELAKGPPEEFGYAIRFETESAAQEFVSIARDLGFVDGQFRIRRERRHASAELETADLLIFRVERSARAFGGPSYGTEYDLSTACPVCGAGAVQISPLVLNRTEIPRKGSVFQTLDGEYLVSPTLARVLGDELLSGLELRQAISHRDRSPLPWFQLIAQMELPPMAPTSGVKRERACPECDRDGYYQLLDDTKPIRYRRSAVTLETLPDATHTYERFGNSVIRRPFQDSHFGQPLLLMKPSIYRIFRELKVRAVRFDPVDFIEE